MSLSDTSLINVSCLFLGKDIIFVQFRNIEFHDLGVFSIKKKNQNHVIYIYSCVRNLCEVRESLFFAANQTSNVSGIHLSRREPVYHR